MASSVIGPKPRRAYLVTLTAVPQNSDAMISAASGSLVIIVVLPGQWTRTFLNCHGSSGSMSCGNNGERPVSGVQVVKWPSTGPR